MKEIKMGEYVNHYSEEVEVAHTAAIIENELRGGFLQDIAATKVEILPENLTPREVAEIILPEPKGGEPLEPRWTLVDAAETKEPTKIVIAANNEPIINTVKALELRKVVYGKRQPEDMGKIEREKATFLGESGANKTSIVRRRVAIKAMRELYGDDLSSRTLHQLGGGRVISPTREITQSDGTKKTVSNTEHKTIRDLAGEFLPTTGSFTEFDANLATALAEGYEISMIYDPIDALVVRKIELTNTDSVYPKLVLIQPAGKGGLEAGFDAMRPLIEGRQLVITTNGQYRQKDIYQAGLWAEENGIEMLPPVALGDEPGDQFPFRDGEIVVPNRPEAAYINELIILWRLAMKRLPTVH